MRRVAGFGNPVATFEAQPVEAGDRVGGNRRFASGRNRAAGCRGRLHEFVKSAGHTMLINAADLPRRRR